jgi:hypothetical protein
MKNLFTIMLLLLISGSVTLKAATFTNSTVVINGNTHDLLFSVPDDYNAENTYPLVIGLHYCGGNANAFRSALQSITDELGMIIACPDYSTSNGGWIPDADTSLFRLIVAKSETDYRIDPNMVFLTGMSCNAEFLIRHALAGVYPFKGIFPWDPYNPNVNNYNLNSKIPVVLAFGTSDPAMSEDIKLYKGLKANGGNVSIEMVQGVAHTLDFPTFGSEMIKCLRYLMDTNAISIDPVTDFEMYNNETFEVQVEIVDENGSGVNVRAISSNSGVLPAPAISQVEGTQSFKLDFTPVAGKSGSALIQFEAEEIDGSGVKQVTFNVKVNRAVPTAVNNINTGVDARIYPNPATDLLHVEWKGNNAMLSITDISGKEFIAEALPNHNETVSLHGLNPGLYLVKIISDEGTTIQKLLVR